MGAEVLPGLVLGVLLIIVVSIGFAVMKRRKGTRLAETSYRAFFIMGVAFLPLGMTCWLLTGETAFASIVFLGLVFLAIGAVASKGKSKLYKSKS